MLGVAEFTAMKGMISLILIEEAILPTSTGMRMMTILIYLEEVI